MTPHPAIADQLESVKDFYEAWDAAVERDRRLGPEGFFCPEDCARCCERSPAVPVTAPEALAAAEAVKALDPDLREILRGRLRSVTARVERAAMSGTPDARESSPGDHAAAGEGLSGACPLLVNGRCAIYAARPLFCRAYGFSADGEGEYFGCEVLYPALAAMQEVNLTSLTAGRAALPTFVVKDAAGHALPECGMLAELVDRLLDSRTP